MYLEDKMNKCLPEYWAYQVSQEEKGSYLSLCKLAIRCTENAVSASLQKLANLECH